MNDNEFWVKIWGIIAIVTMVLSGVIVCYNYYIECKYIENGYSRTPIIGYSYPTWTKNIKQEITQKGD